MHDVALLGHERGQRKHLVPVAGDLGAAKDARLGLTDFAVAVKPVDKILRCLQVCVRAAVRAGERFGSVRADQLLPVFLQQVSAGENIGPGNLPID